MMPAVKSFSTKAETSTEVFSESASASTTHSAARHESDFSETMAKATARHEAHGRNGVDLQKPQGVSGSQRHSLAAATEQASISLRRASLGTERNAANPTRTKASSTSNGESQQPDATVAPQTKPPAPAKQTPPTEPTLQISGDETDGDSQSS